MSDANLAFEKFLQLFIILHIQLKSFGTPGSQTFLFVFFELSTLVGPVGSRVVFLVPPSDQPYNPATWSSSSSADCAFFFLRSS